MKDKQYSIGIDIGGTNMKAVLFGGKKAIANYSLSTVKEDLRHLIIMVAALAEPLIEEAKKMKVEISGAGIGAAGVINYEKGEILRSPNLPILDGVKLAEKINERLGLPCFLDNDANCFVRAEAALGAGVGRKSVYGLTIGTGIGGGWWHDGKIHRGAHGAAGEPGHATIEYGSGIDLEAAYQKLVQGNAAKMAEEAYRGDNLAEKAFEEVGLAVGTALANIVNIIDPEIIILGGGVIESSELFLSAAKKTMRERIFSPEAREIKIAAGKLGPLAGAIGAAMLVSCNS